MSYLAHLKCLRAAARGDYFEDFKASARLSTNSEVGFEATLRALFELVDDGIVFVADRKLHIADSTQPIWFIDQLDHGQELAWEICYSTPHWKPDYAAQQAQLARIGLHGEEFVLEELRTTLPAEQRSRIRHVSLVDDRAGFDISSPSIRDISQQQQLEVKTSSLPGDSFQLFITRNELEKAKMLKNWKLVLVKIANGAARVAGHLDLSQIEWQMPIDANSNVSWTVARVKVDMDNISPGLP